MHLRQIALLLWLQISQSLRHPIHYLVSFNKVVPLGHIETHSLPNKYFKLFMPSQSRHELGSPLSHFEHGL